jgi:hypothetical protein
MMLRDAMLRHWWDEWMNEVRKGIKETQNGFTEKVDELEKHSGMIGTDLDKDIMVIRHEIKVLYNKSRESEEAKKDKIMKDITKMESKITQRFDDLDKKMKGKKEIEI